ncbi:hypothetical protein MHBO_000488 [Bonamia ostreae]|uniref:RING-type domain-containing protein n=1 Tax=Bonamia ostreae TaxID=126728 RepID=A0ABV2AFS8_9EUKA
MSVNLSNCSICLELLEDNICTTRCGHIYHTFCLRSWMLNKRSCPLCKKQVGKKSPVQLYTSPIDIAREIINKNAENGDDEEIKKFEIGFLKTENRNLHRYNKEIKTENGTLRDLLRERNEDLKIKEKSKNELENILIKIQNSNNDKNEILKQKTLKINKLNKEIEQLKNMNNCIQIANEIKGDVFTENFFGPETTFEEKYNVTKISYLYTQSEYKRVNNQLRELRHILENKESDFKEQISNLKYKNSLLKSSLLSKQLKLNEKKLDLESSLRESIVKENSKLDIGDLRKDDTKSDSKFSDSNFFDGKFYSQTFFYQQKHFRKKRGLFKQNKAADDYQTEVSSFFSSK